MKIGQDQVTKSHRNLRQASMVVAPLAAKASMIEAFPLPIYSNYATDNITF